MQWTNDSVLKLADGGDPLREIERRAKKLIRAAQENGWNGPPYNPVKIADILGIPVRANGGIADARTLPTESGVIIEYNPTHSRERVRFSLAHEIAHILFDDHAQKVRNRHRSTEGDEWQLEMLCNIAAAQFVMPVGSFPDPDSIPDIEELMLNRRELDVSTEAYLIRYAKASKAPVVMFRATPKGVENGQRTYCIDYIVSGGTTQIVDNGSIQIPKGSRIRECSAIGLTSKFAESWIGAGTQSIHAVGIPNAPGEMYPRVAGLIRDPPDQGRRRCVNYVHRDIFLFTGGGRKIMCQLTNHIAKNWGGGVALQTSKRFPGTQAQYKDWITAIPIDQRLGKVHFCQANPSTYVASIVAQEGYGRSDHPRIRYNALAEGLERVAELANEYSATVHMPRIGVGAAGGNWEIIEEIIEDCLISNGIDTTVYDLPPRRDPELSLFD